MKITIDPNKAEPFYAQLFRQLSQLILSGEWAPGTRLPSEAEFEQALQISRSTIRQALGLAEADGLIERVPGKGTFVTRSPAERRGNNRLLGYVTCDFLPYLQNQLGAGVESVASAQGYRVIFYSTNRDVREEDDLLEHLVTQRQVGGLVVWPVLCDDPARRLFQMARQGQVPLVLVDRTFDGLNCDWVVSDNYGGAYAAVRHLLELGHRRIVFLSQPLEQLIPVAERRRGYEEALRDAGLTPLLPWMIGEAGQELEFASALNGSVNREIEQIVEYLQRPDPPTAIFALNDLIAMQAVRAAKIAGLRVPEDVSLVGFDDENLVNNLLDVQLTTVAQDGLAMGRRAAELLIERIEGHSGPPRQITLPTRLKVRASTARPGG